jgi:hypothetical protein
MFWGQSQIDRRYRPLASGASNQLRCDS